MLKLYPHNQTALDAVYKTWEEGNRFAAIVHAVGTGKSFIYHRLIQDNPSSKILVLNPTRYIFDVQQEAVKKAEPTYDFDSSYDSDTYVKEMVNKRNKTIPRGYDYIILDEFHRAGAKSWQEGVTAVLKANPKARVLGLSATPIRYSDGGRDMAKELFEGNVVSELPLDEAIEKGILKKPIYVACQYKEDGFIDTLEKRVKGLKDRDKKKEAEAIIKEMRSCVTTSAQNLPTIFHKHIKKKSSKIIVFCSNVAELSAALENANKWFSAVNSDIHTYKVHIKNKRGSDTEWYSGNNKKELDAFNADNSKALKVLYCINALLEGIHVEGVDAGVMLRTTSSPRVYLQTVGRILSTGQKCKSPLIIDCVSNFAYMEVAYQLASGEKRNLPNDDKHVKEISLFKISDYTISQNELLDKFNSLFTPLSLEEHINRVKSYLGEKQ